MLSSQRGLPHHESAIGGAIAETPRSVAIIINYFG